MDLDKRRQSARDYALAFEAASYLAAARLAIALLSFPRIAGWTTRRVRRGAVTGVDRSRAIADVRWAIAAAGARLPGQSLCFPRALAAQAMLRRRGVSTTMTYGARPNADGLDAHAWLTAGTDDVVGHEVAPEYSPVAVYSNEPMKASSNSSEPDRFLTER